ncbi:MAG: alkaline phosphatase family protein, partial [Terriglobales bacterium]
MNSARHGCTPRRTLVLLILGLIALVLIPSPAHAYVGPGAGFAFLSSLWALFVAFLYSAYAFLTWPFRQLYRAVRHRKGYRNARFKRVIIIGFDGMDPELAERFMQAGRLPNLQRLRDNGTFRPLRTTVPAISPVAWSSFQTGCNPGKHNIYDFFNRNLGNYL